jgi:hypothetical protein
MLRLLADTQHGGDVSPERRDSPDDTALQPRRLVYFTVTTVRSSNPKSSYSSSVLWASYRVDHVLANESKHFPM